MCSAQCKKVRKRAIGSFVVSLDSELAQVSDESVRLRRGDTPLALRHREDAGHGAHAAIERELADEAPALFPIAAGRLALNPIAEGMEILLKGAAPPARLRLTAEEYAAFRPLAVLEPASPPE